MYINNINYEDALFEQVKRVKEFNQLLVDKYHLTDLPYNVSGRAFPKIGSIVNNMGREISYRFHGRGATIYDDGYEIDFDVDASSKYQIIISYGGFCLFLEKYFNISKVDYPLLDSVMDDFEQRGIFIQRKPSDGGTYHVNESWYVSKLNGLPFTGENKFDTDWTY